MISRYRALISFFIAGLICCPASAAQDLIQVPAAMHLSSDISDGDLSLNELAGLAEQNGLKAVVLGDHYDVRVRYGLPPLRNILRRSVSGPSVSRFGVRHYLDEVRKVRQQHPGLVIVPGVEHTSHYYWSGSPFNGTLQLNNWHKHLLITGLDEQGFKNLPSPENNCGGAAEFDPLSLWPLLLLFAGLVFLKKRSVDYRQVFGISCGPYSQCWRRLGLVLIAVSAVFLINNFPFTKPCYSLYAPAIGGGPYQKVIDYVNKNGGTVFWAHPEADYKGHRGKVAFRTRDYEQELLRLKDYTGFALYYEGYNKTGVPGGIWDTVLEQYCAGERARPAWAMAELDYEGGGGRTLKDAIKDLRTVLLVKQLSPQGVTEALKTGKMYVVRGQGMYDLVLDEFSVQTPGSSGKALMGETLTAQGTPEITVRAHLDGLSAGKPQDITLKLIRNGQVIRTETASNPFAMTFRDDQAPQKGMIFYRLELRSPQKTLVSNPIFVRFPI